MPKMTQNQIAVKIPLSQIVETGNVRNDYDADYIDQLATSILNNGLLQPIVVKRGGVDENGLQQYELIAGHCRKRAFELLCKKGNDFSNIDACIKTGDKRIMQLIENVQRSELTASEKEKALQEMIAAGYTQKQIAEELAKPISWVSDILAGNKVRQTVENAGIDTSNIATKTLSQIRSIPKEELPAAVEKIKKNGGTSKAATDVLNEYRDKMPEKMPQKKKQTTAKSDDVKNQIDAPVKLSDYVADETITFLWKVCSAFNLSSTGSAIDCVVKFAKENNMLKE